MNNKRMAAWAVALSAVVVFLLGLSPIGNFAEFGTGGIASILLGVALLLVGVIAAIVAYYWGAEPEKKEK